MVDYAFESLAHLVSEGGAATWLGAAVAAAILFSLVRAAARTAIVVAVGLCAAGLAGAFTGGDATTPAAANAKLQRTSALDADDVVTGSIAAPVVYIQVPDMDRRFEAETVWRGLKGSGLRSPGIDLVSGGSPARAEVRYFNESDRPLAERVAAIAASNGLPGAVVRGAAGPAPRGKVELRYPR